MSLSADQRTRSCATELVCHDCGLRLPLLDTTFRCLGCGQGLDIDYDYELAKARIAERGIGDRPAEARELNIWRFEELLPIVDARAQARVGRYSGRTPLIHADRLGAELGLRKLYLKDDSTQRPSLSYKDRVVSMAVARLLELGKPEIGCVSTGNVGTAVASLAAKAGVAAYVFYPSNMERGKARACRALGAAVIQLDGNYDEANRACRELALATGVQFANITLRPFYAEGAKTVAYETVEQLDWVAPDHYVIPAAGGRSPRASIRACWRWRRWGWRRPPLARSTSPRRRAAARSPRRCSTAAVRSSRSGRTRPRTRSRSALRATARWWSTR